MPLTYQPFAESPQVEVLARDLHADAVDQQRMLTAFAGVGLVAFGLSREGLTRLLLVALGAGLIRRGWLGRRIFDRQVTRGVRGDSGTKVEESIEINCPADVLYRFWRNLSQLPKIMRHVESVEERSKTRSHWKVNVALGQTVEWDAEIISDQEGKMIAWQSLPGAAVRNAGSVWFEPTDGGATRVKVSFEFDPPAGAIGAAVAKLLGNSPQSDLAEDLARFKEFAERELP